jgi:hypothetical protein
MFGRNIGGDQGKSDQRPNQAASGQEEVFTRLFLPALEHADPDDEEEEDDEDGDISPMQIHERLPGPPESAPVCAL